MSKKLEGLAGGDRAACGCHTCAPITLANMRMIVCPTCGYKRCPRANDHRNACTNSNEPGQEGSAYPKPAPQQNPREETP